MVNFIGGQSWEDIQSDEPDFNEEINEKLEAAIAVAREMDRLLIERTLGFDWEAMEDLRTLLVVGPTTAAEMLADHDMGGTDPITANYKYDYFVKRYLAEPSKISSVGIQKLIEQECGFVGLDRMDTWSCNKMGECSMYYLLTSDRKVLEVYDHPILGIIFNINSFR